MKNISFDILIRLKDSISAGVRRISDAMDSLSAQTDRARSRAERMQSVCDRLRFPQLEAFAGVAQRVGDGFAASAQAGMGFGQAMADLSAITGITGSDLERLTEQARRFGKESGLGADTAARAYTVLASQIQVAEIGMDGLNTLQEKSITLAQASGMSLDAAAEALAGTVNQFGLGADQAERVINVLAAGSKYGAAEISELSQSFKVVGASASSLGLSVEETAGALEVLSKANLKGSESGTALRNILLKLTTELGIDLGETSLEAALSALQPKLEDATYLSKLFGAENIAAAQFLIKNAEAVGTMTQQLTGTSTAQEQAAVRTQTTAQKMAELRARVDDVKIGWTEAAGAAGPYFVLIAENAAVLTAVGGTLSVVWGWMTKLNAAVKAATGLTIAQKTAAIALSAAQKATAVATGVWTAAQQALNVALKNNPIGWVYTAIAALAAGVVYAYNHFEGFRRVCDSVWATAKKMASILWDAVVKAFDAVTGAAREAWEWVRRFLGIGGGGAEAATETINTQTDAINANTEARKKNAAFQLPGLKEDSGGGKVNVPARVVGDKGSLSYIEEELRKRKLELEMTVSEESRRNISRQILELEKEKRTIELDLEMSGKVDDTKHRVAMEDLKSRWAQSAADTSAIRPEAAGDLSKRIGQLKDIGGEAAKAGKNIDSAAGSVADLGSSLAGLGNTLDLPVLNVMGVLAQAIATLVQGYATALAGAAKMGPWAWVAFAATGLAQLASVVSAVKNMTAFAEGGIVSGPTMALVGEYAGASNNPEVIAPLNKLRSMIQPAYNGGLSGKVEFVIKGNRLVGVLNRTALQSDRT